MKYSLIALLLTVYQSSFVWANQQDSEQFELPSQTELTATYSYTGGATTAPQFKALILTNKFSIFGHWSIPAAVRAIRLLGVQNGFEVTTTIDHSEINSTNLSQYQVLIFLLNEGLYLDSPQQKALQSYIRNGGGWVGIHAAADAEYDWPWYGQLLGAYFKDHPPIFLHDANIMIEDSDHPSTRGLGRVWNRYDEWYNFRSNPRPWVHVLATLDERTYCGGSMGADHPISWCHNFEGGRSWYTALGHAIEAYREPLFLQHLLGGIQWAAGFSEGDCSVP